MAPRATPKTQSVISSCRLGVNKVFAFPGRYAAQDGSQVPRFAIPTILTFKGPVIKTVTLLKVGQVIVLKS